MSNAGNALLGVNTTVILIGIGIIALIMLGLIFSTLSKILGILSTTQEERSGQNYQTIQPKAAVPAAQPVKQGKISGEAELSGVEDEELAAVIMAAVSHASSIPLSQLRIKSIKSLNSNWGNVAVQEQVR